jgi:RNA polymerase-binding transcription factor DksA
MPPPTSRPHGSSGPAAAVARLHEERAALRARTAQLDDDMAALIAASRDSNADDEHDPEGQTIAYERSQLSAVTSQTRTHLDEVEAALARVAAGTYGSCEVCHRPIDPDRLEARPTARTCVHHVSA